MEGAGQRHALEGNALSMPTHSERRGGLGLILDVLAQPAAAYRYLAHHSHVGLALVAYVIAQLPATLAPPWYLDPELGTPAPVGGRDVIGASIFSLMGLFVSTLLLHGIAWLLGGRNAYGRILQAQALAALPLLFTAPFAVLSHGADMPLVYAAATAATMVWSVVLSVIGVRETYRFSTARAVAALALAGLILGMAFLGFALLLSVAMLGRV